MKGMIEALIQSARKARHQLFGLLFGLSLGSGGLLLTRVCPTGGQCGSCGACLAGLPLLAVVLFALGRKKVH